MAKTADGKCNLGNITKAGDLWPGISVEEGRKHKFVLKYAFANIGNCALGESTYVDAHLIPWFKKATGLDKPQIYQAFRKGKWVS